MPGRWIELHDLTGGDDVVRVISHDVPRSARPDAVLVGRLMDGPPAPSLWGPVGFLDRGAGRELAGLLKTYGDSLGLRDQPAGLAAAMHAASREITLMLAPALRHPAGDGKPHRRQPPTTATSRGQVSKRPVSTRIPDGAKRPPGPGPRLLRLGRRGSCPVGGAPTARVRVASHSSIGLTQAAAVKREGFIARAGPPATQSSSLRHGSVTISDGRVGGKSSRRFGGGDGVGRCPQSEQDF